MKILQAVEETRAICRQARTAGRSLGLVPTMGALHQGHLSLVEAARRQTEVVAVSIFVNPLQFGPGEDFTRYPRTWERDCGLLEAAGVDLLFAPAPEEMYPPPAAGSAVHSYVEVTGLSERLEGKSRPGHFRGVATVVSKLFHIADPDWAFFGQKDAQQAAIIRRMVCDLNMAVRVSVCPIVREADGLAMSSRNVYLDPPHRRAATVLFRALTRVQNLALAGERNGATLAEAGRQAIREEPLAQLDYLEVVHPDTLDPLNDVSQGALVLVAARLGKTRLIDNLAI